MVLFVFLESHNDVLLTSLLLVSFLSHFDRRTVHPLLLPGVLYDLLLLLLLLVLLFLYEFLLLR
jgi:hypothetical protein